MRAVSRAISVWPEPHLRAYLSRLAVSQPLGSRNLSVHFLSSESEVFLLNRFIPVRCGKHTPIDRYTWSSSERETGMDFLFALRWGTSGRGVSQPPAGRLVPGHRGTVISGHTEACTFWQRTPLFWMKWYESHDVYLEKRVRNSQDERRRLPLQSARPASGQTWICVFMSPLVFRVTLRYHSASFLFRAAVYKARLQAPCVAGCFEDHW